MNSTLKIYQEIIFLARKNGLNLGAFKVWFIAKKFDSGNSNIPEKDLKNYLMSLGVSKSRMYAWFQQAESLGLIKREKKVFSIVSWERGAMIAGVFHLARPVLIPIHRFTQKHWLSWAWAGFLKRFEGKPIARKTLEDLTGVAERTQQSYEKIANVRHIENYSDLGSVEENVLLAIALCGQPGHYTKSGRIRKRLGNTYVTEEVHLANIGRTKKVNSALSINELSSHHSYYPLYCLTAQQLKRKLSYCQKYSDSRNRSNYLFQHIADLPNGSVWEAVVI